ncbi:MAG: ChrR family anti-sigma-E factor, partial [Pseudomonadota bacterium]|nr:ChrR family anti-sigma-E factor [Pseudomonadota bacterium]
MSVKHHPSDAALMANAAGSLAEGPALVVAVHLTACAECRRKTRAVEIVGGVLLDELPPAPMAADALARTLARLDGAPKLAPPETVIRSRPNHAWLPEPLRSYHLNEWKWLGPGIRQIVVIPRTKGGSVRLLRLTPGTTLPRHGHSDAELACVLQGALLDERGRFGPSDVSEVDAGVRHKPTAGAGLDCICLIATGGPLRFYGPIGQLIQT